MKRINTVGILNGVGAGLALQSAGHHSWWGMAAAVVVISIANGVVRSD